LNNTLGMTGGTMAKKQKSVMGGPPGQGGYGLNADMVAIGNQKTQEELAAFNQSQIKRLLGTEYIIEKTLKMLDCNPWDDLGNWPADANRYKGMQLSESKMKNEIDHREPRTVVYDGRRSSYPFFTTGTGWHSTEKRNRKSDIEELGEGTNLYFKFLKYFMLLLFFATVFSVPAFMIYFNGSQYANITD